MVSEVGCWPPSPPAPTVLLRPPYKAQWLGGGRVGRPHLMVAAPASQVGSRIAQDGWAGESQQDAWGLSSMARWASRFQHVPRAPSRGPLHVGRKTPDSILPSCSRSPGRSRPPAKALGLPCLVRNTTAPTAPAAPASVQGFPCPNASRPRVGGWECRVKAGPSWPDCLLPTGLGVSCTLPQTAGDHVERVRHRACPSVLHKGRDGVWGGASVEAKGDGHLSRPMLTREREETGRNGIPISSQPLLPPRAPERKSCKGWTDKTRPPRARLCLTRPRSHAGRRASLGCWEAWHQVPAATPGAPRP